MKTLLRSLLLTLLPLSAWAQMPQYELNDGLPQFSTPASRKVDSIRQAAQPIILNRATAACINTTTLDFSLAANSGSWKNHAPVKAGATSTNTTISTAGSYVEPGNGSETTLTVSNNAGTFNGTPLYWQADYTSNANASTQITFTFNRPVNNFTMGMQDIDIGAGTFIDALTIVATQADGNKLNLSVAADATVTHDNAYNTLTGNQLKGVQTSPNNSTAANATVQLNKPITSLQITYQNLLDIPNPGNQAITIDYMTWCTQANVATTLTGPARALPSTQVTYTVTTTASGDYAATEVKPVVQLIPGLTGVSGGSYNPTTGLLTLAPIQTLAPGNFSTTDITFNMPTTTVTGKASSTIDTDDSDPSDNNGSLVAANVTTTVNTAPTAQAKSATVSNNTAIFSALPALSGTDPENDVLTYTIATIPVAGFGVLYYSKNGTRTVATANTILTGAQAATLEFKRGGTALPATSTFQYFVSDLYGGKSANVSYTLTGADRPATYSSLNNYNRQLLTSGQVLATLTDPDGNFTSASVTGTLPEGIVFSTVTGEFTASFTTSPTKPKNNTYNFTVTTIGSAAVGSTSTIPVTITIFPGTQDVDAAYSTGNNFNRDALTIGTTLATATDDNGPITDATITSGTLGLGMSFNVTTGEFIVSSTTAPFAGTYTYTARTTDATGGTSTPNAIITVFDDTEAIYALNATPAKSYTNGDALATVSDANVAITNATALSGTSALPPGVGLNPATGQFTVADRTKLVKGTYPVQVRTTDATGGITIQTVNIIIKNNPLPVTLVSFGAQAAGSNAQLSWKTAQELNNDHFEVERSFDGRGFVAVGKVQGQGTSQSATTYAYTDARVANLAPAGLVYYRLRQVDTDGTTSLSEVHTVRFALTARTPLDVYPNPTEAIQDASLDLSGAPAGSYQVTLVDMKGRVLRTFTQNGGTVQALQLTNLPNGTYLVQVQGNGQSFSQRVVKE